MPYDSDPRTPRFPKERIDRLIGPLDRFVRIEAAGGVVLVLCTVVALVVANSPLGPAYHHFWATEVGIQAGRFRLVHSLEHWINDGLMVLFFGSSPDRVDEILGLSS